MGAMGQREELVPLFSPVPPWPDPLQAIPPPDPFTPKHICTVGFGRCSLSGVYVFGGFLIPPPPPHPCWWRGYTNSLYQVCIKVGDMHSDHHVSNSKAAQRVPLF